MAYRLAIAISGAVSLGAYEAGVMFEIIRAIKENNLNYKDEPENQIKIDVLTGASAGGMTAAILAQKLLFDKDSLDDPVQNSLYQAWVQQADIHDLLKTHPHDDANKAILSSGFIGSIAENMLYKRYSQPRNSSRNDGSNHHPAAADTIRLGLAMANLNGVDYGIPVFDGSDLSNPKAEFVYTRFQDSYTKTITKADDKSDFWESIGIAARACGAFPFAFQPLKVPRYKQEVDYAKKYLRQKVFPNYAFTYTDGGVFNNYPLGLAKKLVNEIDKDALDYESRFYLYIAPSPKVSEANRNLQEENATLLETAKALGISIFTQSHYQDWEMTGSINELIRQLDTQAYGLRELVRTMNDTEIENFAKIADQILAHLYLNRDKNLPSREKEFERLKKQYLVDPEAQTLLQEKGEVAIDAWIKSVQVLEQSGGLGQKDPMTVYTVTASDKELAGEGLAAFAGFFELSYRQFDYDVGRKKAAEFLKNLNVLNSQKEHLKLSHFKYPQDLPAAGDDLSKITLGDMNPELRKQLAKRLSDRADRVLKEAKLAWLVRKPLMWFFINREIKKVLQLIPSPNEPGTDLSLTEENDY